MYEITDLLKRLKGDPFYYLLRKIRPNLLEEYKPDHHSSALFRKNNWLSSEKTGEVPSSLPSNSYTPLLPYTPTRIPRPKYLYTVVYKAYGTFSFT
ncbi:hypothetical protein Avbf_18513 [Armadillidium vulgare]|nr:hypothetical protein Avbf_18513 [Armadillidium vulgare]